MKSNGYVYYYKTYKVEVVCEIWRLRIIKKKREMNQDDNVPQTLATLL